MHFSKNFFFDETKNVVLKSSTVLAAVARNDRSNQTLKPTTPPKPAQKRKFNPKKVFSFMLFMGHPLPP